MNLPGQLNLSPRLLLGPGPGDVHPRVLGAMTTPMLGYLDPQFVQIMDETQGMLRSVFQTENVLTFPVSATGMAGMETCVVNLIEPGDRMVVCSNGFFGQRMADVAGRSGAQVSLLERPWGDIFDLTQVREVLAKVRPKVLGIVHSETSTGAWQPVADLGNLCHEFDTLLILDTVTSLGCVEVALDDWEVDAAYSCSQKGLSCPPGLAPVSFSARAVATVGKRQTKVQNWYLDITLLQRYWLGEERIYHHTAPASMIYALREGLRLVLEEGLQPRWQRHGLNHRALKAGLAALGIGYTAAAGHQLPQLNAVRIPDGVNDLAVRKQLLNEFGIEIGGGLGEFKGKVWRIGLMGHNSRPNNVLVFLGALEQCLLMQGLKVTPGSSVAAANRVYAERKK
ncbi:MAG TPA: alanine--glyoxylate aminotransferase family protein [Gemmataceae bacterium]|nr:alanine--glyoxylate aminotransferase family protein [Gemmataceae bacterium]